MCDINLKTATAAELNEYARELKRKQMALKAEADKRNQDVNHKYATKQITWEEGNALYVNADPYYFYDK